MIRKNFFIKLFFAILLVICVIFLLIYFQVRSIENINKKLDLIKEGMNENDVIKLLGKPRNEKWIESNDLDLPEEIKTKHKKVYIIYYEFKTFSNKVFIDRLSPNPAIISCIIVLDKKKGKVLTEIERRLGDTGMIKFSQSFLK